MLIVLASEVAAILSILVFFVAFLPMIFNLALSTALIALVASWATWRFRTPGQRVDRGVAMILVLAVVVLIVGLLSLSGIFFGPVFGVLSGVAAVVVSVILSRTHFRGAGDAMAKDAVVTLGLVGLPAPIFFGAYYLASLFGLTSG